MPLERGHLSMSEIELLKRISSTHIEDCLVLEAPTFAHSLEGEHDVDGKVAEFLLAQNESLATLLTTEIPATSVKIHVTLPVNLFEKYVNHNFPIPYLPYDVKRLRMRKGFHSKEPIFQVEQYTQEVYDSVLSKLSEQFPFLVVNAIINSELGQQEVVRKACEDYLHATYIAPLIEQVPQLSVKITLDRVVTFHLDVSKLDDTAKESLSCGDFGAYVIQFD